MRPSYVNCFANITHNTRGKDRWIDVERHDSLSEGLVVVDLHRTRLFGLLRIFVMSEGLISMRMACHQLRLILSLEYYLFIYWGIEVIQRQEHALSKNLFYCFIT